MTVLRPYQTEVIVRFHAARELGNRRILMVAPTGAGKTVIAGAVIAEEASRGGRILFLAHRRELVQQAVERLFEIDIDAGVIQAGTPPRPEQVVQVASVQTLHARAIRGSKIALPAADLVVVDEAHHVRAKTWHSIVDSYQGATVLGLTATPVRGDGRGLGNVFDALVECPSVGALIALGYLVPTRVYAPTVPDLKGVQTARGDYVKSQLAERMDQAALIGDIVTHWHRLAENRRTVVFASGVAHSIHLRDEFRLSGVRAEHIDGTTDRDERERILARLESGDIDIVCNAMVLTEGWDAPTAACAVLARPTRQLGMYRQMIGRVLRPAPGKTDALILDHAGAVVAHGFAEDEIAWTLEADKRAENASQTARSGANGNMLTTCPECSAIRTAGQPCRACGWKPQRRPEAVEIADGDLGRVDRKRRAKANADTPQERDRWHRELAGIAAERGYKAGWVGHKFKEKFGTWPATRHVIPAAPSPEVASWVRSRNIAWAKAREKAES